MVVARDEEEAPRGQCTPGVIACAIARRQLRLHAPRATFGTFLAAPRRVASDAYPYPRRAGRDRAVYWAICPAGEEARSGCGAQCGDGARLHRLDRQSRYPGGAARPAAAIASRRADSRRPASRTATRANYRSPARRRAMVWVARANGYRRPHVRSIATANRVSPCTTVSSGATRVALPRRANASRAGRSGPANRPRTTLRRPTNEPRAALRRGADPAGAAARRQLSPTRRELSAISAPW